MTPHPPPGPRERTAWCLFDFANSSFTTVIITVVFGRVFVGTIAESPEVGNSLWALSLAVANFASLLGGPILGGWVDAGMGKRRPLIVAWAACCALTAMLGLFGRGDASAALVVVTAANIAFCLGENLIASFLPELAPPEEIGRLSARGWATGYLGGLLSLVLALVLVEHGEGDRVPLATAIFFFVAGLPTVVWLKDRGKVASGTLPSVADAFAVLRTTWAERARYPDLGRLLVALFLVQGGVSLVIGFSAIFATEALGLPESETILLFIVIQLAAALGAVLFGRWQDQHGSRWALLATTVLWIVATVLSLASGTALMESLGRSLPEGVVGVDPTAAARRGVFWVGALLAGAAMGSSQSAGRAMVALLAPPGREAEWFGLWGLSTKAAACVSAALFAVLTRWLPVRDAMGITLIFFMAGLVVLRGLDEARGRAAAGRVAQNGVPS